MNAILRSHLPERAAVRARWEVSLSVEFLALIASLYFCTVCSAPFWRAVIATDALTGASGAWALGSLFLLVVGLQAVLFCILLLPRLEKAILVILAAIAGMASHYAWSYGTYFDADMVRNVLATDTREATDLLTVSIVPYLLVVVGLPLVALTRVRIHRRRWVAAGMHRIGAIVVFALLAAVGAFSAFQDLSSLMRNHRELRHLITPGNVVMASAAVLRDATRSQGPRRILGADARPAAHGAGRKPRVMVLVVGETVRAQNWGLNGYARQTTPRLAGMDVLNFPDVTACGTSTEVSLPCMFSPDGRDGYDKATLSRSESLLHVLEKAGVSTLWRDNQSGCKGVCTGLAFEKLAPDPAFEGCADNECVDELLLKDLDAAISRTKSDQLIVLHQMGNHGPSYYRRAPDWFQRFQPTCRSDELGKCSREEIVNSYDNAILATDDLIARAITMLATRKDRDTALLYLSDHGESLGEGGVFLHGLPRSIAPEYQTKVPMVAWFSPDFRQTRHLEKPCLVSRSGQPASHDNLFHTVLGVFEVSTTLYSPELDLLEGCAS